MSSSKLVPRLFTTARWLYGVRSVSVSPVLRFYSNSTEGPIFIERLGGEYKGVVLIRMADKKKKNAINKLLLDCFRSRVNELKNDKESRVVVVRSDVPGTFCSGADLIERATLADADVLPFVDNIRALTTELADLPVPVIAAINGWALGGGLEVALGADIRVSTKKARMGLVETKWSLLPGGGGSQRLARIVGLAIAKELIFTARIIDGIEASRIGLVNHAVDGDDEAAYEKALEIAAEIISKGPLAVRAAKTAIACGAEMDLANGLRLEQQCYGRIIPTKDRQEGMRAFREKRTPVYKGE